MTFRKAEQKNEYLWRVLFAQYKIQVDEFSRGTNLTPLTVSRAEARNVLVYTLSSSTAT
jgi:hypothetical protein